jgi:hypothetical protein
MSVGYINWFSVFTLSSTMLLRGLLLSSKETYLLLRNSPNGLLWFVHLLFPDSFKMVEISGSTGSREIRQEHVVCKSIAASCLSHLFYSTSTRRLSRLSLIINNTVISKIFWCDDKL